MNKDDMPMTKATANLPSLSEISTRISTLTGEAALKNEPDSLMP